MKEGVYSGICSGGSSAPLNSIKFTDPGGLSPYSPPPEYASEQCPCKIIFHFFLV